ncbi:MAG TPA: hypothetical protein VF062_25990 [Candidatus Limnocylindrales bacterium]
MALSLRAGSALVWSDPQPFEPDDQLRIYHREMLTPFGIEVDEELLRRSSNVGFPELAEAALRGMTHPIVNPDLLILAYGLPDIYPLKSTTSYLNHLLGGGSRSFAVSEQGLRAPFTALHIADAFVRAGRYASLALFVCDQTTLPYHDPVVHDTPLVDSAAVLYFDNTADAAFRFAGTTRAAAGPEAAIKPYLSCVDPERMLLVVGPWVPEQPVESLVPHIHRVEPGTYCTSVWLALARHHERWAQDFDALVLCDTDPRTGISQAALLHHVPSAVEEPRR